MIGYCNKCNETKALAMYRKVQGGKRYYRPYCTQCWTASRREYQKAYQERNAEKLTAYHAEKYARTRENGRKVRKRHYDKWKKVVFDHYGHQCSCCGESEPKFLTIDHANDDGAQHRKEVSAGVVLFRWLASNGFPETFRVLCFNCNVGRYHNGGVCPHKERRISCVEISKHTFEPSNWIM